MEKIQAALAKARATREGGVAPVTASRPTAADPGMAPLPPEAREAEAAWAGLKAWTPELPRLLKARITTVSGGRDATAFDVMRTKTLQTMRSNNWRRLAITSPSPGCGKSTIALNLAFSLSRQSELRSILMELDLRRPALAKILGATPSGSVTEVLEGRTDFSEQALCYQHNLALSLCTSAVRNPAELLHAAQVPLTVAEIETRYAPDLMIFDMPPMLLSDDMMAFAGQVDCVLLVAGAEQSTIKEIDTCERELASQTNVMGVVLNKCRYMGQEYGYSYYG